MQRFLTNFFVEFLVELDVTSTGCVALRCVAFCCLLLIVLCCDVMCCDVSYLLLYFVGLKFLSFPVPSLHDLT